MLVTHKRARNIASVTIDFAHRRARRKQREGKGGEVLDTRTNTQDCSLAGEEKEQNVKQRVRQGRGDEPIVRTADKFSPAQVSGEEEAHADGGEERKG